MPALVLATKQGNAKLVKILLKHGADPSQRENDWPGKSALHYAVAQGNLDLTRALLAVDVDLTQEDMCGRTALFEAVERTDTEIANLITTSQRCKPPLKGQTETRSFIRQQLEVLKHLLLACSVKE